MQEIIKELSVIYGNNSIWINITGFVLVGLVGLINILIGLYGNSKIEKYKHELSIISKRTEINYKEHFDSQTKAIKQLFEKYVNLEYSTNKLIEEEFLTSPHNEFKTRIFNWRIQMSDIHRFYNRNMIIFSDRIKMEFKNQLIDFDKINKHLKSDYQEMIDLENEDTYETQNDIDDRINNIKNKDEFQNTRMKFGSCKKLMEEEYKKLIRSQII